MMKKTIQIITSLLLTSCLIFSSCSEDDSDFTGGDSYFVSFSLTVDGVLYPASIIDNQISITIPSGVDLSQAEVNYKLSENATVSPNPQSITDWSSDQIFRVQSYNNQYSPFTYTLSIQSNEVDENIILLTQADVNAFAAKNVNKIAGNLIIGSASIPTEDYDVITNLENLSSLKNVEYNVVINNSFGGTNLEGLSNLEKVGGLYLGTTATTANPVKKISIELPNLKNAGNIILSSDSLISIELAKLEDASEITISSRNLKDLDMGMLSNCRGNLTLKGSNTSSVSEATTNSALTNLILPKLAKVSGNFLIENFWKASKIDLSNLKNVGGSFKFNYIRTIKEITLPNLESVAGAFTIQSNDGMTKFSAPSLTSSGTFTLASLNIYSINLKNIDLPKLETVQGNLELKFAACESLTLPALKKVDGTLSLNSMYYIESFSVPSLISCNKVSFSSLTLLNTFDASKVEDLANIEILACKEMTEFKSPKSISEEFKYSSSSATADFIKMTGLESVGGALTLSAFTNPDLTISGIKSVGKLAISSNSNIETVSFPAMVSMGDFSIITGSKMTHISAPVLTSVASFNITNCQKLQKMEFPKLATVDGLFKFYGASSASGAANSLITDLDTFSSLTSVGSVDVRNAGKLSDFSGLKNIVGKLSTSGWMVSGCKYNPTLQNMLDGKYTEDLN